MKKIALYLLLLIIISTVNGNVPRRCRKDSDCHTEATYCSDGYYCENCLPCREFNREQPSYPSGCAKDPQDCGPCIMGTALEELTGMRYSLKCLTLKGGIVIPSSAEPTPSLLGSSWIIWTVIVLGVFIFISFPTVYFIRRGNPQPVFKPHQSKRPTAPPWEDFDAEAAETLTRVEDNSNPSLIEHEPINNHTERIFSIIENEEHSIDRTNIGIVQAQPFSPNDDGVAESSTEQTFQIEEQPNNIGQYDGVFIRLSDIRNGGHNPVNNQDQEVPDLLVTSENRRDSILSQSSNNSLSSSRVHDSIETESEEEAHQSEEEGGRRPHHEVREENFTFWFYIKRMVIKSTRNNSQQPHRN